MHFELHPDLLHLVAKERFETLRREAHLARLRREVRTAAKERRRLRAARRREHRPHVVAPPPAALVD